MKFSIAPFKIAKYFAGSDPTKSKKDIKTSYDNSSTVSNEDSISTVTYNQSEFLDTSYATDDSFPTFLQNIEQNLAKGSVIVPKQPIPMAFWVPVGKQMKNHNLKLYFIQAKVQTEVGVKIVTVKQIDATGAIITCQCEELSSTLICDGIVDALAIDKFVNIFNIEILLALLNVSYYKSMIVNALASMTTACAFQVYLAFILIYCDDAI